MNSKLKDDLVVRYAIYLAAKKVAISAPDNKLTDNEKVLIEKEISNNPEVSEYIDFLQKSYTELYQDLGKSAFGDITIAGKQTPGKKVLRRFNSPLFRYPIAAAAILLFITFSMVFVSKIMTPSYYSLIDETLDIKLSVPRSESTSLLNMGKAQFNQGKYEEAITEFSQAFRQLQSEEDSKAMALCTYYLGLTYLKKARQTILGQFPMYSPTKLDSAFKYLEISRPELESHNLVKQDLYWQLGVVEALRFAQNGDRKSYSNADRYLSFIIEQNTERSQLAFKLLTGIKN